MKPTIADVRLFSLEYHEVHLVSNMPAVLPVRHQLQLSPARPLKDL